LGRAKLNIKTGAGGRRQEAESGRQEKDYEKNGGVLAHTPFLCLNPSIFRVCPTLVKHYQPPVEGHWALVGRQQALVRPHLVFGAAALGFGEAALGFGAAALGFGEVAPRFGET
jgi:hypothetical protein